MDKFKNVLKPDTDIRAVLAEDKALMKALDNGLKADWKSVMDWYNTERKKIQEELKKYRQMEQFTVKAPSKQKTMEA